MGATNIQFSKLYTLIWISNFLFWQKQDHTLYSTLMKSLNAFDEYLIENLHSILRYQTSEADSGELLCKKAKALDDGYNPNEHDEAGLTESTFQLQILAGDLLQIPKIFNCLIHKSYFQWLS